MAVDAAKVGSGGAAAVTDVGATWEHPFGTVVADGGRSPPAWVVRLREDVVRNEKGAGAIEAVYRSLAHSGSPYVLPLRELERGRDGRAAMVFDRVDAVGLPTLLRQGPFAMPRALAILRQICRALASAHAIGVNHRALSPASVLIGSRGNLVDAVLLIDFGLGALVESCEISSALDFHPMTPERVLGFGTQTSEDVYLAGCIGYWMLAGVAPFTGDDVATLRRRHAIEDAARISSARGERIPAVIAEVMTSAMAKDPDDRFGDMTVFEGALVRAQRDAGITTPWDGELASEHSSVGARERPPATSGVFASVSGSPFRGGESTGPHAVVQARTPSGPQPVLEARRTPSGPQPVLEAKRAPSGPQPVVEATRTPSGPQPVVEAKRTPSGPQATLERRAPSGPHATVPARTPSGPHATVPARTPSGPQATVTSSTPTRPLPHVDAATQSATPAASTPSTPAAPKPSRAAAVSLQSPKTVASRAKPDPAPAPAPKAEAKPAPAPAPAPKVEAKPAPPPAPKAEAKPAAALPPAPKAEAKPATLPKPADKRALRAEAKPEPAPAPPSKSEAKPAPDAAPKAEPDTPAPLEAKPEERHSEERTVERPLPPPKAAARAQQARSLPRWALPTAAAAAAIAIVIAFSSNEDQKPTTASTTAVADGKSEAKTTPASTTPAAKPTSDPTPEAAPEADPEPTPDPPVVAGVPTKPKPTPEATPKPEPEVPVVVDEPPDEPDEPDEPPSPDDKPKTSAPPLAESLAKAKDAQKAGRTGDAIFAYEQALRADSDNRTALTALTRIHFDRSNYKAAAKYGKRAVAVAPSSAPDRIALGDAYFRLGKTDLARAQYEKAAALGDPTGEKRLKKLQGK